MTTLAQFVRWIQAAENKRDFDMACAIYRSEHGPKALKAALDTIEEIALADMAERKANLMPNPKGR
jgi:hypothetical protein